MLYDKSYTAACQETTRVVYLSGRLHFAQAKCKMLLLLFAGKRKGQPIYSGRWKNDWLLLQSLRTSANTTLSSSWKTFMYAIIQYTGVHVRYYTIYYLDTIWKRKRIYSYNIWARITYYFFLVHLYTTTTVYTTIHAIYCSGKRVQLLRWELSTNIRHLRRDN